MKVAAGPLHKMTTAHTSPVQYTLSLGDEKVNLNDAVGRQVHLSFTQQITCVACERKIKKSYQQGYCFPCTQQLAQCDLCILQPYRCHYHLGTCREPAWGEKYCMIPHWVYLSNTTGVKVGITRAHQATTRWMDQGAIAALPIFEVATRQQSGFIEQAFTAEISDRTHWQKMLKNEVVAHDLVATNQQLCEKLAPVITEIQNRFGVDAIKPITDQKVYHFDYPVLAYPTKVKSYNLDKSPDINDVLKGIKGQYLIFENGVINIRKFSGYHVELKIE